jgi:plastocyanin
MGRWVVTLWVALALVAGGLAGEAEAKPKAKVRCHWVKATKKRKRHRVCVKVKAKPKATKKTSGAPATPAPPAALGETQAPIATPAPGGDAPATTAAPDPSPAPAPAAPAAARLQATAREFSLTLSRPTVAAGALVLELVNRGEDAHDLHVRPAAGGADVLSVDRTEGAGAVGRADGTLAAGSYVLYCSLPGHEALGMHAALTVQ